MAETDFGIRITCAPNFRDIGGLPTPNGLRIAHGRIFRSEAVLFPNENDAACIEAYGIRLVCDLRGAKERVSAPNTWWQARGIELLEMDIAADIRGSSHFEMVTQDPTAVGAAKLMCQSYREMPRAASGHLRQVFARIADGHLPLLLHCTAGKDRTGVVIALVLSALGIDREVIYQDYMLSGAYPNPAVVLATRAIMKQLVGFSLSDDALQAITGVRRAYLDASFAAVEAEHGSVEQYLETQIGLTATRAEQMRQALLI